MMCGGSFCVWSILVAAAFLVSRLALSVTYGDTSPKGRGLGRKMNFTWTAKGSHFGGAGKSAGFD